ncbi:replication factor A protein, partial [Trifolium medium]|nr:replication factor A protein [Trifolium medium]
MPNHGMDLIGSENVLRLSERFKYLVDVIGVVTYVRHDKNYFLDGTSTKTVTFKLTDERNHIYCEISGQYVDLFRDMRKNIGLGLPLVVLQFAKVTKAQGRTLVQGIDGITKLYVNPQFYEARKFRTSLILYMDRERRRLGICQSDKPIGYRVKLVVEDETGAAFLEAYDHVML